MFKKANKIEKMDVVTEKIEEEIKNSNEVTFKEVINSDIFKALLKDRLKETGKIVAVNSAGAIVLNLVGARILKMDLIKFLKETGNGKNTLLLQALYTAGLSGFDFKSAYDEAKSILEISKTVEEMLKNHEEA